MNREKRKQILQLKPYLDKLETRRLMSLGGAKRGSIMRWCKRRQRLQTQLAAGDLGAFALDLVQHPGAAADLGLGALSQALRKREGYAVRHGWAASLVSELTAHPRYAAAHHLTAALTAPPASPVTPPAQTVAATTTSASRTVATTIPARTGTVVTPTPTTLQQLEQTFAKAAASQPQPAAVVATTATESLSPTPPSAVMNDPLSVAVGGALDFTMPNLGLGTSGLTFTITPQPLPANMSFNRQTGELEFARRPASKAHWIFPSRYPTAHKPG